MALVWTMTLILLRCLSSFDLWKPRLWDEAGAENICDTRELFSAYRQQFVVRKGVSSKLLSLYVTRHILFVARVDASAANLCEANEGAV